MPPKTIPPHIVARLRIWDRQATFIRICHTSLVTIAVIGSVFAAAGVGKGWLGIENPLSIIAAAAIGVVSAFDLGDKSNGFRRAWRILNVASVRFVAENSTVSESELADSYAKAESEIGDVKSTRVGAG